MDYDLIIRGGFIVDGTGQERYRGDVAVRNGRIAAMGKVCGTARETLDVDGQVVAPGFVDVHTHYDAQVFWDRMLSCSPWHGVTTVVMGNCGFGVAPTRPSHRDRILQTLERVEGMSLEALHAGLGTAWPFETFPQYLDALEARGTALNVGVLVGHTPVRMYVMGDEATERAATPEEIAAMRRIVDEALQAGAVGFSTSGSKTHVGYQGRPVPSRLAEFEEVRTLAGALGAAGTGLFQATIGPRLFHDEFAELHRQTGRPVTWTALLTDFFGPGTHREHVVKAQQLLAEGMTVVPQVACRPIMMEFTFDAPFPFEPMRWFQPVAAAPDTAAKTAVYRDAAFRTQFRERLAPGTGRPLSGWAERATISGHPPDPTLDERPLAAVAAERGVDPADLALDLSLQSGLATRFRCGVVNTDEDEVESLLTTPGMLISLSDAGAHASQLCDTCYSTHLLGHWVRERGTFSLEQAVQRLTQQPAQLLGLAGRGELAAGCAADIVVFDPQTVAAGKPRRVHDLPAGQDRLVADAFGIHAVLVNGQAVRREGQDVAPSLGALPGRLLRHGLDPAA